MSHLIDHCKMSVPGIIVDVPIKIFYTSVPFRCIMENKTGVTCEVVKCLFLHSTWFHPSGNGTFCAFVFFLILSMSAQTFHCPMNYKILQDTKKNTKSHNVC